jgi:hypothetical protein
MVDVPLSQFSQAFLSPSSRAQNASSRTMIGSARPASTPRTRLAKSPANVLSYTIRRMHQRAWSRFHRNRVCQAD